jgi:hypothetical protein
MPAKLNVLQTFAPTCVVIRRIKQMHSSGFTDDVYSTNEGCGACRVLPRAISQQGSHHSACILQ